MPWQEEQGVRHVDFEVIRVDFVPTGTNAQTIPFLRRETTQQKRENSPVSYLWATETIGRGTLWKKNSCERTSGPCNHPLGGGGIVLEEPFGAGRSADEFAATIWTNVVERGLRAVLTIRTLERTDKGVGGSRRQVGIADFTVGTYL